MTIMIIVFLTLILFILLIANFVILRKLSKDVNRLNKEIEFSYESDTNLLHDDEAYNKFEDKLTASLCKSLTEQVCRVLSEKSKK